MVKGMWEPIVAAVLDDLPVLRSRRTFVYVARFVVVHQPWWSFLKKMNKLHFSCTLGFLGGLSCCFPSGIFMFGMLNDHTANTILYFGFAEVIVVAWFYGVNNFLRDIKDMSIPMPRQEQYAFNLEIVSTFPLFARSSLRNCSPSL